MGHFTRSNLALQTFVASSIRLHGFLHLTLRLILTSIYVQNFFKLLHVGAGLVPLPVPVGLAPLMGAVMSPPGTIPPGGAAMTAPT